MMMVYTLVPVFLVLLMNVKDTDELSVSIHLKAAAVFAGDDLIITSTITKTPSESWKSFLFYVSNDNGFSACRGAFYTSSAPCTDAFGCGRGFGFTCNYTHFNLLINDVTLELLGTSIYAQVTHGSSSIAKSENTTIQVKIPLIGVSLIPNDNITKTETETQEFTCFAKSLPISNLIWRLNGSVLATSHIPVTTIDTITSKYTYKAMKIDNGKRLSCTAVYGVTEFTEDALINVLYPPIVSVSPNYELYEVLENKTKLQLTCIVTDSNPSETSYRWKINDTWVPGGVNYTIPIVQRSHTGSYACDAKNKVGYSEPSSVIQLKVLYGIDIITISKQVQNEGTRLVMICSGQSYPEMTDDNVIWTKQNNSTFNMTGKQLVIANLNRIDSGTYVCSVVIKLVPTLGMPINVTGRTTVEVDVLYRPKVGIAPDYTVYKVIENTTNLKLNCNATYANPAVTDYRWYKDGSLIDGSTTVSYMISTVQRSHTGSYTCDATNSVGYSDPSSEVYIDVLYGVDTNPIGIKKPNELTRFNVSCNVKSNPKVTNNDVIWSKQNNASFGYNGLELVIGSVHRKDSGTYICSVVIKLTPTLGQPVSVTGTTTVEVNVLYKPTVAVSPEYNQYNVIENTTNLQLTCEVTDANPNVTSYRWYKDISVISNDATYTISTVHRSHNGIYSCDATNVVGTSILSSTIQLNIMYGVEFSPLGKRNQTEGNSITITCSAKSYPLVTGNDIKWSKQKNTTFNREGMQLVINNVNRLDSGTYVCYAVIQLTPTVGQPVTVTGKTTVEVEVLYRPDVTIYPDITPYQVKENDTNLDLTCNVTDANPNVMSYRWFKNGDEISTVSTYIYKIPKVYRSHTGNYACDARNAVGHSDPSKNVKLDVLYGVSLKLSTTKIDINESDKWELSCIGDGNPVPKITIFNRYNSTIIGEQRANVTYLSVNNANCVDTGIYSCSGNNTIGESVTQSANITVACKPRTYNNRKEEDIFISNQDGTLNISTTFISFPLSGISWSRELLDGNQTGLDSEFISSTTSSDLPYETISMLEKNSLKEDGFGVYIVNASNIYGSFILRYHVIQKRPPFAPTNLTASCDVTKIRVTWISRSNGGDDQFFRINFVNDKSNKTIYKDGIADKDDINAVISDEMESLSPDTLYLIFVEATNVHGTTKSTEIVNCTTQKNREYDHPKSSALVGGIAGSISAIIIVFVVIGSLYIWRRRQVAGRDNELIIRGQKKTDEEEDGLKENPLYVTSAEASNTEIGPVYGVVNKQKQQKENITCVENNYQGPVYSQVQKLNKKGKKTQLKENPKKDNSKDIELGTVYENSDKLLKYKSSDEMYANAGKQGNGVNLANVYSPKKNKDGLIYADLDLIPTPTGNKFVIRGLENKTNYAMIDLTKTAEPLPSDDEDEDKDNGNMKSPDNKSNE